MGTMSSAYGRAALSNSHPMALLDESYDDGSGSGESGMSNKYLAEASDEENRKRVMNMLSQLGEGGAEGEGGGGDNAAQIQALIGMVGKYL